MAHDRDLGMMTVAQLVVAEPTKWELQGLFFDWFCAGTSLPNKAERLFGKLLTITPSTAFDADKTRVIMKNNCPVNGRLYDDFRIVDMDGNVLFCVIPSEGYAVSPANAKASVWGHHPVTKEFQELVRGQWKDVKLFFHGTNAERVAIADETAAWNAWYVAYLEASSENTKRDYAAWEAKAFPKPVEVERTFADLYE